MKKIISLLVVFALVVSITACNKSESTGKDITEITISFWEPGANNELQEALEKATQSYAELHPGVSFRLLSHPSEAYHSWLKTRIAANDLPDIVENSAVGLKDMYNANVLHNIKAAYSSANPYADNEIWSETFAEGRLGDAHCNQYEPSYCVPIMGLGIAYFYNKDIYSELGLEVPETWGEFIENCKKIEAAQYNPVALFAQKNDPLDWLSWYMFTGMYANNYLSDSKINVNGDSVIDTYEFAKAVDTGYFDVTKGRDKEVFTNVLDKMHEYSRYCKGASSLDEAGAKVQFLTGKAAHIMSGSWDIKSLTEEEGVNAGAFPLPRFTAEDSEYAGENMKISSVDGFAISKNAEDDEKKTEICEDFLMYLTSPEVYAEFTETFYAIPVVKSDKIDSKFTSFMEGKYPSIDFFRKDSSVVTDTPKALITGCLTGKKLSESQLPDAQKAYRDYVQRVMEKEGMTKENNYKLDQSVNNAKYEKTEAYTK